MTRLLALAACSALAAPPLAAQTVPAPMPANPQRKADVQIVGHVVKPDELPPPDVANLRVPAGFVVEKFAADLGNARILAVSAQGNVYVTRREQGDVLLLKPGPDGLAAGKPVRAASRAGMHGIAFHKGHVYLITFREIFRADVLPDGTFGPLTMIVADLPDAGQHHNRTLRFGPDGMLYVSVGSTCNECNEPNPENATIIQFAPDGRTKREIFAKGLRNTIGFGWHPASGELWGMDHGIDWLGDDEQPEELNRIEKGKHYGWPYFFGANKPNPHTDPPAGVEKSDFLKVATPMVMGYQAHAAPMQMSFYTGTQFPAEYRNDAFVSMRGSWNRKPPSGYEVVRVRFTPDGKPAGIEPFVTGFLTPLGQHGRLCGNAVAADGTLLFSDDRNGVIYRVRYAGPPVAAAAGPAAATPFAPNLPAKQPLALLSPEGKPAAKLSVTTSAFKTGEPIPAAYSAYEQNASPPLSWAAGPAGTQSYAVLLEDPDADAPELPVVHWVAWNVPAAVTSLREGLQPAERLEDPKGLSQGRNYLGRVGYAGPRPPAGDPPHHYHLQVFALDATLDLPVGAKRADLLAAMKGHVLAGGEVVGTFARPVAPKKP